jgi:ABC-type glycerol-3-phosphate transport system permease component
VPFVYPFAFLISMALKTPRAWAQDQTGFSAHLTTVNLASAWSGANLGRATLNSLLAVIVGSVVCTCVAAGGAYWFLRHWNRVSQALLGILICFWVLPYVVFIIPLFVTLARLGLINNLWILGLLYAASYIPFGIYLVHAYLRNAAIAEVVEAARVDGANSFGVFRRIVVPLSKPVLGTLAALTFVWCWGDLIGALVILQDPGHWTVTVAASALVGRYGMQTQTGAAAALIGIVPVIAVFLFAQKAIVRGITAGVGK